MDSNKYEGMYKFDMNVFMALGLALGGKTHLAYRNSERLGGVMPRTLCNRRTYGRKVRLLTSVDVLGAITTTPCLQCIRIAFIGSPNSIKEIEK